MSPWMTGFPDAEGTVNKLVVATNTVYTTITTELLPTPAKSHYTFNLRDLSKVFQGMLMADINQVKVLVTGRGGRGGSRGEKRWGEDGGRGEGWESKRRGEVRVKEEMGGRGKGEVKERRGEVRVKEEMGGKG